MIFVVNAVQLGEYLYNLGVVIHVYGLGGDVVSITCFLLYTPTQILHEQ